MRATRHRVVKAGRAGVARLSRTHAPADLSPVEWQRALRRQFGSEQPFTLENTGAEPFFSDFLVGNPQSKTRYRVAIRGRRSGDNFCACPDYATNELGTHMEFTLARPYGRSRAPRRPSRRAGSHPFRRSTCGTTASAQCICAPAPNVRRRCGRRLPSCSMRPGKAGLPKRSSASWIAIGRGEALQRLFPNGAASPALVKSLKVPLYPYQAEGALFVLRAGRALIVDDMGLARPSRR